MSAGLTLPGLPRVLACAMHGIDYFIQDLAVILAVAGLVGWVCQRLGMSVVVGFLVAGIVVGSHSPVIPLVSPDDGVERIETQIGRAHV